MENYTKLCTGLLILLVLALPLTATKYAGEIFAISPGVLSSAMGGTGLTYKDSFSAGWWNPALLSANPETGMELMHSQHFEGLLKQNQLSLIFGKQTHTSLTLNHLMIDKIKLTRLENPADSLSNDNRPIVWKTVSNQDFILSGGIARQLGESVSLGISPKLAYRSLAQKSGYAFGADLGLFWQTSANLALGANLRDFFSTQVLWDNGTHEIVIPNLDLEIGYDFEPFGNIPVHVDVRSEMRPEEQAATISTKGFSSDLHAGLAIQPLPSLKLLACYDADAFTAGLGIGYQRFSLNYAFRNGSQDDLGYSQRISAGYQW